MDERIEEAAGWMQRALMPDGPRERTSAAARKQWMDRALLILSSFGAPVQLENKRSVASAIEQIRALSNASEVVASSRWFEGELVELDVMGDGTDSHGRPGMSRALTVRMMQVHILYERGWTLAKIGRFFGFSRERAREIRNDYKLITQERRKTKAR